MIRHTRHIVTLLIAMCLCLTPFISSGQKFHFGVQASLVASQIDGDNLKGFNHLGYSFGVLGGYAFDDVNWMVIELQRVQYGSTKKQETSGTRVELDLTGYNVLVGYSVRFGDSWDGLYRFRAIGGPRFNSVTGVESQFIDEDDIKKTYLSFSGGLSYFMTPQLMLDLSYTHALTNVLDNPLEGVQDINKLVPYYMTFGVSYYISR